MNIELKRSLNAVSYLAMAIFGASISIIGIVQMMIVKEMQLNLIEAGLFLSVHSLGLVVFIISGGIASEKAGRKRILCLALLGHFFADLIAANSYTYKMVLINIFFVGGFGGVIESIGSALIIEINQEGKSKHVNRSQLYLTVGAVVGLLLFGAILLVKLDWRVAYYCIGLMELTCFFWLASINYRDNKQMRKADTLLAQCFQDRVFVLICICMFLYTGTEVTVFGWMATFVTNFIGLTVMNSITVTLLLFLSQTIGRIIFDKIIGKFKISDLTIYLALASSLFIFALGFLKNIVLFYLSIVLIGLSFSSLYPFILSMGGNRRSSSFSVSVLVVSGSMGAVIIPGLVGVAGHLIPLPLVISATSVLMAVLSFIVVAIRKNKTFE